MAKRQTKAQREAAAKRSAAAKRGAETKARKKAEAEAAARKRSEAARRAAETRKNNAERRKRSEAARRAAETRKQKKAEAEAAARKRSEAAKKGAETRKRKREAPPPPPPKPEPKQEPPRKRPKIQRFHAGMDYRNGKRDQHGQTNLHIEFAVRVQEGIVKPEELNRVLQHWAQTGDLLPGVERIDLLSWKHKGHAKQEPEDEWDADDARRNMVAILAPTTEFYDMGRSE